MSNAVKLDKLYTYADLLTWPEDERWELIDGVPYAMAAPNTRHQRISMNLSREFSVFLKDKNCEVFAAPFDVRLYADKDDDATNTIVQPDLIVVCDPNKIDEKGCKGAPDLVVEILSPSNSERDRTVKFQKYQTAGVPEVWFVDPDNKNIQVFISIDGKYDINLYGKEDALPVGILPGFKINLKDIF